jgi:hypothetical protein
MYCRFLLAIAPIRILELTAAVCVPGLESRVMASMMSTLPAITVSANGGSR